MTTNDKNKYIEAWNSHIKQLSSLGLPLLDVAVRGRISYYEELKQIQQRLEELVLIAAKKDFDDE